MVTPSNKLKQKFESDGVDSVTYNEFFSYDKNQMHSKHGFDDSKYDCICFDEILFVDMFCLSRINSYCKTSDKFIMATGDSVQLENFGIQFNNVKDKKQYLDDAIDSMFHGHIYLQECKRVETDEDRQKLVDIYNDIFVDKLSAVQIMRKYFKATDKVVSDVNICYFNETARCVGSIRRKQKGFDGDYAVDENICCDNYYKTKNVTYNTNVEFEILSHSKGLYTIQNVATDDTFEIKTKELHDNFRSAYGSTCHSFQGSSTDDVVTIFDYNCKWITREWLYVAITRATNFDNVYYYVGKQLFDFQVEELAQRKIRGYIEQDLAADRNCEGGYLDLAWFKRAVQAPCYLCGETMKLKDFTADRLNDDLAHFADNCMPCCLNCNRKKIKLT
eukprot:PhM_4_TR16079/c7_g4_i6/m.94297